MDTPKHKTRMTFSKGKENKIPNYYGRLLRFTRDHVKGLALFLMIIILSACNSNKKIETKNELLLPVFGPKKLASQSGNDTIYHTVADFSFTNQYKENITQKTTEGKIYVADFFFATCQSICPAMTNQLTRVQQATKNDNDILILSHTVNPMHDTAEVLLEYATKYGAIKDKWHFLTGSKKSIYELAKKSYLVSALEDDGTAEGFIHSETFLLVDKQHRVRGIYDGTDSLQVNKLMSDINILKKEK